MTNSRNTPTSFDKQAELYQIGWRNRHKVAIGEWGEQNRVKREHILPTDQWLLGVWPPIHSDLIQYIHVSDIQANTGKHNLKSSWTQCANLFFPFRSKPQMTTAFAGFLAKQLGITITSIEGLELEYAAPGNLDPSRLLGETGGKRGSGQTSPDVAVLFRCDNGKSGIYLIENKYVEHSFYNCASAKKTLSKAHSQRGLLPNPDPDRCNHAMEVFAEPEMMCHQNAWGRTYWSLLADTINEQSLSKCGFCPALHGGYQLFRQQALAQGIATTSLFDYVISGVAYDQRNTHLITCLNKIGFDNFANGWSQLFNSNVRFHCFTHQDLVSFVSQSRDRVCMNWTEYVTDRYNY